MYNRYVPQPDGSFQRSRMQEQNRPGEPKKKANPIPPSHQQEIPSLPTPLEPSCCNHCPRSKPFPSPSPVSNPSNLPYSSITQFLKHLLPKDFNIEDLLVILLLLLMAGDCREDQNTALLTLVLYLFL